MEVKDVMTAANGLTEQDQKEMKDYAKLRAKIQQGMLTLSSDITAVKDLVIGNLAVTLVDWKSQSQALVLVSGERHEIKRSIYVHQPLDKGDLASHFAVTLVRSCTSQPSPNADIVETVRKHYDVELKDDETFYDSPIAKQIFRFMIGEFDTTPLPSELG